MRETRQGEERVASDQQPEVMVDTDPKYLRIDYREYDGELWLFFQMNEDDEPEEVCQVGYDITLADLIRYIEAWEIR